MPSNVLAQEERSSCWSSCYCLFGEIPELWFKDRNQFPPARVSICPHFVCARNLQWPACSRKAACLPVSLTANATMQKLRAVVKKHCGKGYESDSTGYSSASDRPISRSQFILRPSTGYSGYPSVRSFSCSKRHRAFREDR